MEEEVINEEGLVLDVEDNFKAGGNYVSEIVDPFAKENIESVWIHVSRPYAWEGKESEFKFEATINFRAGSTTGAHKMEAGDFDSLIKKLKTEIKHL